MPVVFFLSAVWTIFLVLLNISPNATANNLMGTSELDHGNFWQLGKLDALTQLISTSALVLIAATYLSLLLKVLRTPASDTANSKSQPLGTATRRTRSTPLTQGLGKLQRLSSKLPPSFRQRYSSVSLYSRELIMHDGRYRKIWARVYRSFMSLTDSKLTMCWQNLVLEIPELVLQTLSLWSYTREGVDERLVIAYASLITLNCTLTFYHVQIGWRASALQEIISDAM
ncbi:hypothetical protein PINS_up009321 [Pythium insidiosum]|nr:hypothetical protein PINS_up009321 [Pythium insidiosum]